MNSIKMNVLVISQARLVFLVGVYLRGGVSGREITQITSTDMYVNKCEVLLNLIQKKHGDL